MEPLVLKERDNQHVYVPDDIRKSLELYAKVEREKQTNPIIAEMITWKSLGIKILRNEVQRRGHYVGKVKP
jgi:hypothetical protein